MSDVAAGLVLKQGRTPHATTSSRILNEGVDSEALEEVVATDFKEPVPSDEAIALDGKA